jgi:hypothetical protein
MHMLKILNLFIRLFFASQKTKWQMFKNLSSLGHFLHSQNLKKNIALFFLKGLTVCQEELIENYKILLT